MSNNDRLLNELQLLNDGLKEEINKLKEGGDGSVSFVIIEDILNQLVDFQMNSHLLISTLIGKTVSRAELKLNAIMRPKGTELAKLCNNLVMGWKDIYRASTSTVETAKPKTSSGSTVALSSSSSTKSASSTAPQTLKSVKSSIDTITITYGDMAENHVGMQKIGVQAEMGYTLDDITQAKSYFESIGGICTLMDLRDAVKDSSIKAQLEPAYVLLIKNGVDCLLKDIGKTNVDMYKEQSGLEYDTKVFMYGQVRNKHARYNLCFSEEDQEPDYENKKGRIVKFEKVPLTNYIRTKIPSIFERSSSSSSAAGGGGSQTDKSNELQAEGNYYFDASKCGIGFHGDAERLKVVAVRLGRVTIPMHWQWYHRNNPVGDRIKVCDLSSGAMYIMSEKATGFDWKRSSIYTLRHAAGAAKFLK